MQDAEDIIKKGAIRYIVTSSPKSTDQDDRPDDMIPAHQIAVSHSELFTLLHETKLFFDFNNRRESTTYIWRYEGELTDTESRLPVVIPTSNIIFKPNLGDQ